MNVVILDTGCANLNSVKSAIARHGYEPKVSRDPDVVLLADKLFLPGVGTAQAAMDQVRERELFDPVSYTHLEAVEAPACAVSPTTIARYRLMIRRFNGSSSWANG